MCEKWWLKIGTNVLSYKCKILSDCKIVDVMWIIVNMLLSGYGNRTVTIYLRPYDEKRPLSGYSRP